MFDVGMFDVPRVEVKTPKDFPELAEIVTKCSELGKTPNSKEKLSVLSDLLKDLSKELNKVNIAKSIAEATYSNIRRQIRAIAFDLLPQRIDQRIIQTLASRGGELTIEDLSLILNLTEETIEERMIELDKVGLIKLEKKNVLLV